MTAPPAVLDQALDQATREILAVTGTLTDFTQRHRLPLHRYSLRGSSPAARRFNPATRRFDQPVIPRVDVSTSSGDLPGAFLAWCQALAVDEVTVERREHDLRRGISDGFSVEGRAVVDPFVIDREVDKYRKGKRTLTAMCAHYGVSLDGAHDAAADAIGAARVAWAIGQRYPEIASMDMETLVKSQKAWHAERQDDFWRYLKRQGKPCDDVSGEWPQRAYVPGDSPAGREEER